MTIGCHTNKQSTIWFHNVDYSKISVLFNSVTVKCCRDHLPILVPGVGHSFFHKTYSNKLDAQRRFQVGSTCLSWVFTCLYAMLYYGFCLPCFFPSRFLLRRTTSMRSHMSPGRRIHCWATTRMSWAWRRPSRSPLQKQWSEFQNNHFGLLVPTLPLFGSDISFQLFWGCPWTQVDTDLDWVWGCQYYPTHMWIDLQGIPVGSVWN